jgi:hypothetical protein
MTSRSIETSIGLSTPSLDGQRDLRVRARRASYPPRPERQALHRLAVQPGDDVARLDPALEAGVSSIGLITLMKLFSCDLDAETAELALGLHLHVAERLRVHVARNAGRGRSACR